MVRGQQEDRMKRKPTTKTVLAPNHTSGEVKVSAFDEIRWCAKAPGMIILSSVGGNDEANIKRAAACWNAMNGVADPAALVRAAEEMAYALARMVAYHCPSGTASPLEEKAVERLSKDSLDNFNAAVGKL
jgi:hypothetical protein